jgi:hypothetical protein
LVYNPSKRSTFDPYIRETYNQILRVKEVDSIPLCLVSVPDQNEDEYAVSRAEGEALAHTIDAAFFETYVFKDDATPIFEELTRRIVQSERKKEESLKKNKKPSLFSSLLGTRK